jgi:hypothetical protein
LLTIAAIKELTKYSWKVNAAKESGAFAMPPKSARGQRTLMSFVKHCARE